MVAKLAIAMVALLVVVGLATWAVYRYLTKRAELRTELEQQKEQQRHEERMAAYEENDDL